MSNNASKNAFLTRSGIDPSLEDYKAFHGMVCGITASRRCIASFDGCCLFANRSDYENSKDLATFDYLRTPTGLNLFTYYLLVVISFTGLSTLLGYTELLLAQVEDNETFSKGDGKVVKSKSYGDLEIPAKAIDYLIDRSQELSKDSLSGNKLPQVQLTRRFEFNFGNWLSVVMCHFVCSNGRKYLVEVYSLHGSWIGAIATIVEAVTKRFLVLLGSTKSKQS